MSAVAAVARRKRQVLTVADAARHLRRASLGPTPVQITAIVGTRIEAWLDAQVALPVQQLLYPLVSTRTLPGSPADYTNPFFVAAYQTMRYVHETAPDILRHKVAYALHDFFPIGGIGDFNTDKNAWAAWYDLLQSNAFTTYRQLLEAVTRSPLMAFWLTYWGNSKAQNGRQPDENYAREIMQLFSIGLWELRQNGTRMLTGELEVSDPRYVPGGTAEVPTYTQADILNVARVFTGAMTRNADGNFGSFPPRNGSAVDFSNGTYLNGWAAIVEFVDAGHEMSLSKVALQGRINIPIGTGAEASVEATLDALTAHPSTGPFFCKRMIQLLVTSNPSPAYVARVVAVFNNNGAGQRGNLGAVFKAIYADQEALAPVSKGLTSRVPGLEEQGLATFIPRKNSNDALGYPIAEGRFSYPGNTVADDSLGSSVYYTSRQAMFNTPSVFGRWPVGFSAPGAVAAAGLVSPEAYSIDENGATHMFNISNSDYIERLRNTMSSAEETAIVSDLTGLINDLCIQYTADTAPQTFKDTVFTHVDGLLKVTQQQRSEAFGELAWLITRSPWAAARR